MNTLYIFNPDHDMALANDSPFFNAPLSAKEFSKNLAWIVSWVFGKGYVFCDTMPDEEMFHIGTLLGVQSHPATVETLSDLTIEHIVPWGWNSEIVHRLKTYGINEYLLPSHKQLQNIRRLSHRKITREALSYLKTHARSLVPSIFPEVLDCISDIDCFLSKHKEMVMKMPWSGSGKGLRWCKQVLTENDRGWIMHTIRKQGCVIAEKRYKVIQNFAMEFFVHDKVLFSGYSLFETQNGIYKGNALLSDSAIELKLSQWVSTGLLQEYRSLLIDFFSEKCKGTYRGYFGVDMFIYEEEGYYKIHPVVEINFRLTMGLLAHKIRDLYLLKDGHTLCIDFNPLKGELLKDHLSRKEQFPLSICNGKIEKGYFALNLIDENTKYRMYLI